MIKRAIISILLSVVIFTFSGCQMAVNTYEAQTTVSETETSKKIVSDSISTRTPTPEPTITATPTPEPTETPIPEPVQEEGAEILENEDKDDIEEEIDELTARTEALDKTMYAVSAVNVRAGDSTDYKRVDGLAWGQEVKVTGRSTESGWFRITLADGSQGYVSNKYLSDNKPQKQEKATQQQAQAAQTGTITQAQPAAQAAPAASSGHSRAAMGDGSTYQVSGAISDYQPTGAFAGLGLH